VANRWRGGPTQHEDKIRQSLIPCRA